MFEFRIRVDVENLRERLSRSANMMLDYSDAVSWLNAHGFRALLADVPDDWMVDYVADENAIEQLQPWEVLEKLPVTIVGEASPLLVGHA
jgi:hypothetical protein